jgi:hypothetical protein
MVFTMQLTNEETSSTIPRRPPPLPEPPVNELLRAEIAQFVDALRTAAEARGDDPANALPRPTTSRERSVMQQLTTSSLPPTPSLTMNGNNDNDLMNHQSQSARATSSDGYGRPMTPVGMNGPPSSALSSSSSAASSRPSSSSSARTSSSSSESPRPASARGSRPSSASARSPHEILQPYNRYLNAFEIDKCVHTLQGALRDEQSGLMMDINQLQDWLDEEVDLNTHLRKQVKAATTGEWATNEAEHAPPTAAELRDIGNKLRKAYLDDEQQAQHRQRVQGITLPLPGQAPSLPGQRPTTPNLARPLTPSLKPLRRIPSGPNLLSSTPHNNPNNVHANVSTSSLSSSIATSTSSMSSSVTDLPSPLSSSSNVSTPGSSSGRSSRIPAGASLFSAAVGSVRRSATGTRSSSSSSSTRPLSSDAPSNVLTLDISSDHFEAAPVQRRAPSPSRGVSTSTTTPLSPVRSSISSNRTRVSGPSPPSTSTSTTGVAAVNRSRTRPIRSAEHLTNGRNQPVPAYDLATTAALAAALSSPDQVDAAPLPPSSFNKQTKETLNAHK